MAIEKDNYGFRVGSWNSKIAATGQETFERLTNCEMAALVGCTEGSASNYRKTVAEATGWSLPASNRQSNGDTAERKPRQSNGKRKGCFPNRASVVQCLNKYLNNITDSEDPDWIDNPTWSDYKSCLAKNGLQWQAFIMGKAKGEEEINAFSLWITSNGEADLAESEQYKAQQKALDAAVKLIEAAGGTVTW